MSLQNKRTRRIRTAAITVGILLGMTAGAFSSQAHAATETATQPAAKVKAKVKAKAKPAKKGAVAEKFVPLPEASPEQLAAASRVLIGRYECEFSKKLLIDANDTNRGYFNIRQDKQTWVVKPVLSSTGAVRLEDTKDTVLVIQILTKSMLLNVKTGHRMVDGCVHEVQRAAEEELRKNPPKSVFDTPAPDAASAPK
ncbi:hypothetical protein [Aquabacterium sp.]|uniref:hypothetical protein n=1 Tax=Aquabacterium sp. TaxID=1872578 RepID=UPI001998A476|nr:hypothetical protein [Aquabacterium sp.]MBC7700545.1 hypothetical protein [Aquabacterium sp.]